jgi:aspartate carbamoyltransferase regulatory subunit
MIEYELKNNRTLVVEVNTIRYLEDGIVMKTKELEFNDMVYVRDNMFLKQTETEVTSLVLTEEHIIEGHTYKVNLPGIKYNVVIDDILYSVSNDVIYTLDLVDGATTISHITEVNSVQIGRFNIKVEAGTLTINGKLFTLPTISKKEDPVFRYKDGFYIWYPINKIMYKLTGNGIQYIKNIVPKITERIHPKDVYLTDIYTPEELKDICPIIPKSKKG